MRYVIWEDRGGWKHRSAVKDGDPDSAAPGGIPADPPDLSRFDDQEWRRELHNQLVTQGVFDWRDLQRHGNVDKVILGVTKRRIIALFRTEEAT